MKLKHEDGENYGYSKTWLDYDGKLEKISVDSEGVVEVDTQVQAQHLAENGFNPVDGSIDEASYALKDLTVDETSDYLEDIEDLSRLKELRKLESEGKGRKNALQSIDDRIQEVKNQEQEDEDGEKTNEDSKEVEGGEEEDGE